MAHSGYPVPAYPPAASTSTADHPIPQQAYYPPAGYPPMSQVTTQAFPVPAGGDGNYNNYSSPPPPSLYYAPVSMSQHDNYQQQTQNTSTPVANYPPAGYPPVSQGTTQAFPVPAGGDGNYNNYSSPPPPSLYYASVSMSQHDNYQQQTQNTSTPVANYPPIPRPPAVPLTTWQPNNISAHIHTPGTGTAAVPSPTQTPNYNAIANPIPVVGSQYCLPYVVDLAVTRKLMTVTDDFDVTDVNNSIMFKVRGKFLSLHDKRFLFDSNGKPIVNLRHKIPTAHGRWSVYRGDGSHSTNLLFTAKKSSVVQLKTKFNVYLANRRSEEIADFKVHGSWSERSCVVYVGESNTIAAKMHRKESAESYFLGKDTFMITIYPNVDYAFVVALILILDAI